ncbi:hypothetical protein ACOMHN_065525 [Nucella lapillus]
MRILLHRQMMKPPALAPRQHCSQIRALQLLCRSQGQQSPKKTARSSSSKKDQLSIVDKEVLQALKEPEKDMDENEHFFRSLLPLTKMLDAVETLELRSEIQHLVLRHVKAKANKVSPPNFRADAATALPAANRAISTSPQPCPSASTYNVTEDYNQGTYRRQQPYQEYTQDEYSTGHQYQRLAFE